MDLEKDIPVVIALLSAVDVFFADFSHDPGPRGYAALFLIIGFRALSKQDPPILVLVSSAVLVGLVVLLNHSTISCPREAR